MGYTILNIGKTGIGISSIGNAGIKWDYNSCYNEALKYTTKIEFYKQANSAWCKARKNNWLKDYIWLKSRQRPKKYWNYDTCYKAAKKCKIINDLRKNYEEAYKLALKNNWLKDYTWFKELRHRHSKEEAIEKKKKCKNKQEFKEKYLTIYRWINRNKLNELYKYINTY